MAKFGMQIPSFIQIPKENRDDAIRRMHDDRNDKFIGIGDGSLPGYWVYVPEQPYPIICGGKCIGIGKITMCTLQVSGRGSRFTDISFNVYKVSDHEAAGYEYSWREFTHDNADEYVAIPGAIALPQDRPYRRDRDDNRGGNNRGNQGNNRGDNRNNQQQNRGDNRNDRHEFKKTNRWGHASGYAPNTGRFSDLRDDDDTPPGAINV